ncbi:YbjN domain-containing protein [Xanthomonas sp. XNM01]|uniref:YbjN domain-containing protein n=1 Tax=Xanthomonas sp. XNM01 TaxID=2769289 RepID=UPI00177C0CBF|nr:YbjN domain-containing protein [Xanthomonas sp. XNM01]MBD9368337.1 hypothetical protein [Xanthomonas sp. XNM01]
MIARLACALLLALPGLAMAAEPDHKIGKLLDGLGYEYEVDEDGDYKLVMALDEGRTQLVFVRSPVESYGQQRVREVWSPAYKSPTASFPAVVANRLLDASNQLKLGAWVKQDQHAVLVVKIPASADAKTLDEAITAAVTSADEMERELAEDPASDEY